MCGLFGVARSVSSRGRAASSLVVNHLGVFSDVRGGDACGVAGVRREGFAVNSSGDASACGLKSYCAQGLNVVKNLGLFGDLAEGVDASRVVGSSDIVIGHTRKASVGDKFKLENSSPMIVGNIVGAHNGTVKLDSGSVAEGDGYVYGGDTDTERLFHGLNACDGLDEVKSFLSNLRGTFSLSWVDAREDGKLFLARGAWSPLYYTFDEYGNLYWASNPDWFDEVDFDLAGEVSFGDVVLVKQGSVLVFDVSGEQAQLVFSESFIPAGVKNDDVASAVAFQDFSIDAMLREMVACSSF